MHSTVCQKMFLQTIFSNLEVLQKKFQKKKKSFDSRTLRERMEKSSKDKRIAKEARTYIQKA